jgi:hypothetical protein
MAEGRRAEIHRSGRKAAEKAGRSSCFLLFIFIIHSHHAEWSKTTVFDMQIEYFR